MANASMSLLSTQWRLCRIQLINWGTFDGYNDLAIRPADDEGAASVVCITGRSGTGKSTLFDAGTVLMMPYGRTLNAASNLGRGGSPREVRTYVRGMVDTVADERGRTKGKYLRDETELIWSAIVHTWQDTTGAKFSAARFFQLKPGGGDADMVQTFVTVEGDLDPRALRPFASTNLRSRDVRATYPGCTVYDGSGRFFRAIYLALGIGAQGNGTNAMKLLYRIQSGIPMTNVDDLFKELVLDPPSTFELAQQTIDCFDHNQSVWLRIEEARRKREMLKDIDTNHQEMLDAREEARLAESLAYDSDQDPLRLWLERRRLDLTEKEHGSTVRACERDERSLTSAKTLLAEHKEQLEQIRTSIYERGGASLERLRASLESDRARRESVRRHREALATPLGDCERSLPSTEDEWHELSTWCDEILASGPAQAEALQEQIDDLGARLRMRQHELDDLEKQLDYYRRHRTNITPQMARARELMARAAGLDPSDIPFAAELMDVPREQSLWRTAINISLAHISDRILVDKRLERDFRRDIDGLANTLGRRYHYDFVDLDKDYPATPKAGHVSSKVVYRDDSPFAAYVRQAVCDSTDHLCVDTVPQLAGGGARITPSGQERVGNRGAIGHSRATLIIGFSNEMLIEDLEAELEDAKKGNAELAKERAALNRQRSVLAARMNVSQRVETLTWEELDIDSVDRRMRETQEQLERLEQDDELRALNEMLRQTDALVATDTTTCHDLKRTVDAHKALIQGLEHSRDQTRVLVNALVGMGVIVTKPQEALCTEAVAQAEAMLGDRSSILRGFERVTRQARGYVENLLAAKRERETQCIRAIESSFTTFHSNFMADDTEHGTTIDEFPYYHNVLAQLIEQRLDDPETEWRTEMLRDVSRHLSRLQESFTVEERALDERLRPINQILGQFAFGERRGRLGVVAERRTLQDVRRFRRDLRQLCSLATRYDFESDEEVIREHRNVERFCDLLRRDLATTGRSARHFLDTRHMVTISARETVPDDPDAEAVVYDSINGKSGGQYQELVAFILGAALLYCLGYNSATIPSFAPVFLDEAFIKADSDHTRRALGALSGLGFQVIIAVPDGKVEAVAPLASQIVSLTKDERKGTTRTRSLLRAGTNEDGDPQWQD